MRLKTAIQTAVAGGVLLCAAAWAQQPAKTEVAAAPQAASVAPATGGMRKATNVEPGSPMATMFAAPDAPVVTPAQAEESAGKSKDGSTKIHGHWVIEVKEKDGTVKDRREFENSYVGGYIMGLYLAGFDVPIDPIIGFGSATNGAGSACNELVTGNTCIIAESLSAGHGAVDETATNYSFCGATPSGCFGGLTSTLMPAGGPYTSWVLSAAVTVPQAGTFDTVSTSLTGCYSGGYNAPTSISPSACYSNAVQYANNVQNSVANVPYAFNNDFTSTALPGGAVTVTAGETLVFTVTISFS